MSTLWEKDTPKSEWNKIKHLSLKEKLEYIWNYYKWPICIAIVLVIFVIAWAKAFGEHQKETLIRGAMINKYEFLVTDTEYFPTSYADFRELDIAKQNAEMPVNYYIDMDGSQNRRKETLTTYQTLMAQIAARELDFMAASEEILTNYNKTTDVFFDLRQCLPTDVFEQLDEEGRIVWLYRYDSITGQEELIQSEEKYPLLIDFSNTQLTTGMRLLDPELFVAFIINSEHVTEFPFFIDYMLNYEPPVVESSSAAESSNETK